jgi:hypothetical protein
MPRVYLIYVMLILIIITFAYVNSLSSLNVEPFTSFNRLYRPHIRTVNRITNRMYNNVTYRVSNFYKRLLK